MEWDDDCRVGTGEQLELEVEGGVAGVAVGASAEKDVVGGGEVGQARAHAHHEQRRRHQVQRYRFGEGVVGAALEERRWVAMILTR